MHYLSFYRLFIRPILFLFDSERIHDLAICFGHWIWRWRAGRAITRVLYGRTNPKPVRLSSLELKNPIGLAAGFDKNALLIPGIETLGFGFIEIGTVTPRPQMGNTKPRLGREIAQRALVNRMGFPNDGAEIIFERLQKAKSTVEVPIGVNIGKQADTPNSRALFDYELLLLKFRPLADYFTVNISSPNTQGLRELQSEDFLSELATIITKLRFLQPIFLKLSPDLSTETLRMVCEFCGPEKPFSGLVLTNTIPTDLGGISGAPLKPASVAMLKQARQILGPSVPIISVGGIETREDVDERLSLGATAVQVYTALIYQGPSLVGKLISK